MAKYRSSILSHEERGGGTCIRDLVPLRQALFFYLLLLLLLLFSSVLSRIGNIEVEGLTAAWEGSAFCADGGERAKILQAGMITDGGLHPIHAAVVFPLDHHRPRPREGFGFEGKGGVLAMVSGT